MKPKDVYSLLNPLAGFRQPYLLMDDQGQITWANAAFFHLGGIDPGANMHLTGQSLISASDNPATATLQDMLREGRGFFTTLNWHMPGGSRIRLEVDAQPYATKTDDTSTPFSYLIACRDLTAEKQKEDRLRLLEAVFTVAEDVILITEAEPIDVAQNGPRIVEVNPAFERHTGYAREEAIGKTPRILQGAGSSRTELDKIRRAMDKWQPVQAELINYKKDGTPFHVNMIITPIADENGWFTHWVSIQRDVSDRKKTEEDLAKITDLLNETQRIARAGGWELDVATGKTTLTDTVYDIFGVDRDFPLERDNGIGFYHPDDQELMMDCLKQVVRARQAFDIRCRVTTAKGRQIWVRIIGHSQERPGEVDKVIGLIQDISVEKRIQDQLALQRRRLEDIIEATRVGTWEWDMNTGACHINERLAEMLGYTVKEMEPVSTETWKSLTHPQDFVKAEQQLLRHMNGEIEYFEYETRMRHKEGHWIWVLNRGKILDRAGDRRIMAGTYDDITERVRHLEQLNLLHSVVESTKDAIMVTSAHPEEQNIIFVNYAHEEMTGYSLSEIQGKSPRIFQGPGTSRAELDRVRQAIERELPIEVEILNYRKDGSEFWLNLLISYVRNAQGEVTHFISIQRDITERKEAELALIEAKEQAEKASIAKSEFLSTMSHEIRTPLNAVIGMTGLLAETKLDAEQSSFLQTIRQGGENLLSIINDILDYSKIEAGKVELEHEEFNLIDPVEDTLDLLAGKAAEKEIELMYLVEKPLPKIVRSDITRLRQVLVNLVNNAIKFTRQGEILIRVRQLQINDGKACIEFSIRDTGIGIPAEKMTRLFKSFSQVDASTTREYGGTGLGLAISRKLVHLLGGEIWVKSEESAGSTFFFTIETEVVSDVQIWANKCSELVGKRALIVDDNETNLDLLTRQLQTWDMHVAAYASSIAVASMLEKEAPEPFAIAILDMHMPGLDGLELGKYIRETPTYAGMPLLLLSSGNSVNSPEQKNIFDGILQKPARTADLLHFVHKLAVAETTERKPAIALPTTGEIDLSAFSILLVEDNMINQRVAQKMLDRFQVQAEIANNGLEALQFVKLRHFDLILMDMQMPVMDGLEATRAIRGLAHTQQPLILAMTANASRTDQQACMAAGMDDFLTKPIRLEVLRDSLVRWLLNPKVNAPTKLPG